MKRASVLAIFLNTSDKTHILFTEKAHNIGYHSDQVSFPGGSIEKNETALEAALRETKEEIGIEKDALDILGRFHDDSVPVTGYIVTPYAAFLRIKPEFKLQSAEVTDIFTVPFEFFLNESNYKSQSILLRGNKLMFDGYKYMDHIIWGLTCRFIRSLVEIISN